MHVRRQKGSSLVRGVGAIVVPWNCSQLAYISMLHEVGGHRESHLIQFHEPPVGRLPFVVYDFVREKGELDLHTVVEFSDRVLARGFFNEPGLTAFSSNKMLELRRSPHGMRTVGHGAALPWFLVLKPHE